MAFQFLEDHPQFHVPESVLPHPSLASRAYKFMPGRLMTVYYRNFPWPLPHISLVTDAQFDALRTEPKSKVSASREKGKQGHLERQFELAADSDPERRYRLFVRQSQFNSGVFSVGLTLLLPENDLILCRYNSNHHGHKNILEKQKLPPSYHQHIATQRYITANLDVDGYAVIRTEYNSLDGAIALIVQECNIDGIYKPDPQAKLFPI